MSSVAFLLLGSNLGKREQNIKESLDYLQIEVQILSRSSLYATAPWGIKEQPTFLNQVVKIGTSLSPEELLQLCLSTENKMGRVRKVKWGERLIDIDILYFNDLTLRQPALKIPHEGIPERRFTLVPLVELAPDMIHPILAKTNQELLAECKDQSEVKIAEEWIG